MKLEAIFTAAVLAASVLPADYAAYAGGADITMVRIAPGNFYMGSNAEGNSKPVHQVSIGYAFEIGKTEVTQAQWKAVMDENPSYFSKCGDDCPVENVNFDDVKRFIKRLNIKTSKEYRLPSEAEWEYACRAGGNDEYCGGNDLDKLAWHMGNSGGEISPVARKKPNAWGLHDMSGNVWEWVQDAYHDNYSGAPSDGSAWESGDSNRVLRCGSWFLDTRFVSAAFRLGNDPADRDYTVGFRLARTLP